MSRRPKLPELSYNLSILFLRGCSLPPLTPTFALGILRGKEAVITRNDLTSAFFDPRAVFLNV